MLRPSYHNAKLTLTISMRHGSIQDWQQGKARTRIPSSIASTRTYISRPSSNSVISINFPYHVKQPTPFLSKPKLANAEHEQFLKHSCSHSICEKNGSPNGFVSFTSPCQSNFFGPKSVHTHTHTHAQLTLFVFFFFGRELLSRFSFLLLQIPFSSSTKLIN